MPRKSVHRSGERSPESGPVALTGFGSGKVILLGEHGVVYGHSAVAGPLSWGVWALGRPAQRCQLRLPATVKGKARAVVLRAFDRAAAACGRPKISVTLESDLPVAMGLGSSAALSVACARLLLQADGKPLFPGAVAEVALQMEQEFHGTPSGVDHTCSAQGRLIEYRLSRTKPGGTVHPVASRRPLKVLVALVGQRGPTRETLAALRERMGRWPRRYERLFGQIGELALEGKEAIESGDLDALGDAMSANHGLLSALQLSSPGLDEMVYRLRKLGALGAKLTGAGGEGGAVIGLFLEPEPAVAALTRLGIRCFGSQLAGPRAL